MASQRSFESLNAAPAEEAEQLFLSCCGSRAFARGLAARRPFSGVQDMLRQAGQVWSNEVGISGWLEAFAAHPRIGERKRVAASASGPGAVQHMEAQWCEGEQAAASQTVDDALSQELAEWNRRYEAKFGHVFLIKAQGRSAPEILAALKVRFLNPPLVEVQNACAEQHKITELRLLKLLGEGSPQTEAKPPVTPPPTPLPIPHISTHVLDTVLGRPGAGISVALDQKVPGPQTPGAQEHWEQLGAGVTNSDGRCGELSKQIQAVREGDDGSLVFRLRFGTGDYLERIHGGQAFFPSVSIVFKVESRQRSEKFHVPLLLTPFSYSTYRGS